MSKWRKWTLTETVRNEQGHDSPVFEAVSGLELSSHLKCYPSSVRGRLTHTAHIKALFLFIHGDTHKHTTVNQKHTTQKSMKWKWKQYVMWPNQGRWRTSFTLPVAYLTLALAINLHNNILHKSQQFRCWKPSTLLPLCASKTRNVVQKGKTLPM